MYKFLYLLLVSFFMTFCFLSCKKKKNAEYTIPPASLSVLPVDTSLIAGLVPLGNINPPGHTFPTNHMYIYFKNPGVAVQMYSPGNLHIHEIARFRSNWGTATAKEEYAVYFGSFSGTLLYFAHLSSLSPSLASAVNGFNGATCDNYSTGGSNNEQCRKQVSIDLNAGDIIGTSNQLPGQFAIDMGMRVNNKPVCPLDYFNAAARAKLEPKLGNGTGTIKRTVSPLCGETDLNVAGTLQGNWYKQGAPRTPEDNHIAFVKDNVEPGKLYISVGTAVPGLESRAYTFIQASSGVINRPFTSVISNGQVYCYNPLFFIGAPVPNTSIIVKLEDNGSLSFEKRNCDCSCNTPYAFTAAKISYTK